MAPKFDGGDRKCVGMAAAYQKACEEIGCHYFDAGSVITSSSVDGVHLDPEQHYSLGNAVAAVVKPLLSTGLV
jgi:hypothetical protein